MTTEYARLSTRVWSDDSFRALSPQAPSGQALWLRILGSPARSSVPGLFIERIEEIADDLGWSHEAARAAHAEILERGMDIYDPITGLHWLPNGVRHNRPANPDQVVGWRRDLRHFPASSLLRRALRELRIALESLGEAFVTALEIALGHRRPNPSKNPSGRGHTVSPHGVPTPCGPDASDTPLEPRIPQASPSLVMASSIDHTVSPHGVPTPCAHTVSPHGVPLAMTLENMSSHRELVPIRQSNTSHRPSMADANRSIDKTTTTAAVVATTDGKLLRDASGAVVGTTGPLLPTIEPGGMSRDEVWAALAEGSRRDVQRMGAQDEAALTQGVRQLGIDRPTLVRIGALCSGEWGRVVPFKLLGRERQCAALGYWRDQALTAMERDRSPSVSGALQTQAERDRESQRNIARFMKSQGKALPPHLVEFANE